MVALAVGAMTVVGAGAGAVAATQGGDDPGNGLAGAINERAGTNLTGDQIQSAQNAPDGLPMFGRPGRHHGGPGARAEIMAPVAELLKLDEAALRDRLEGGDTLAQVAADQGVSKADLVAGIAVALKAAKPADAPERTDAEITEMATRIAEDSGGPCIGGPGGPGGGPGFGPPSDTPGGAGETPAKPAPSAPAPSTAPAPVPATPSA